MLHDISSSCSSNLCFTLNVDAVAKTHRRYRDLNEKQESTNRRPASPAFFTYDNVYKVPEKSKYYLYIYNYIWSREESFLFLSVSSALSLHQASLCPQTEKKKKERKRKWIKMIVSCFVQAWFCREMYSPLRCCSGYLDYTLHAVVFTFNENDTGRYGVLLPYIGEKM